MKQIAIIVWIGILFLIIPTKIPELWGFAFMCVFFFIFEMARHKKKIGLAIIFFILGCLTMPIVMIYDMLKNS